VSGYMPDLLQGCIGQISVDAMPAGEWRRELRRDQLPEPAPEPGSVR